MSRVRIPSPAPIWSARLLAERASVHAECTWGQRIARHSDGGLPLEVDRFAPWAEDLTCRGRIYQLLCDEQDRIARQPQNKRERRLLSREAIWCALQRYGLVKRTRGGLPVRAFKSEGVLWSPQDGECNGANEAVALGATVGRGQLVERGTHMRCDIQASNHHPYIIAPWGHARHFSFEKILAFDQASEIVGPYHFENAI